MPKADMRDSTHCITTSAAPPPTRRLTLATLASAAAMTPIAALTATAAPPLQPPDADAPLTVESAATMSFEAVPVEEIPEDFLSSFKAARAWTIIGLQFLKLDAPGMAEALRKLAGDDKEAEAVFELLAGIGWTSQWFADGAKVMKAVESRLIIASAKWVMAEGVV